MDIGIGLPNMVPGAGGAEMVEWAKRAEARGFSSLGTLDRILYESYEPLTALAAAAAVTERIGLLTAVLLGPLRTNAPLLAKQAQSVQALSGGRLTLGVGLGAREDDYEASGVETGERGRLFDRLLSELTEAWRGGGVGPAAGGAPRLIIGGQVERAFERVARFGDGWIQGASGAEQFGELAPRVREAWSEAGRDGEPAALAIAYYSLGEQRGGERPQGSRPLLRLARRGHRRVDHRRGGDRFRGRSELHRGLREGRLRRADVLPLQLRRRAGRPARGGGRDLSRRDYHPAGG